MVKKKSLRLKGKKPKGPQFLDNIEKHYQELEAKNTKALSLVEQHLVNIRQKIQLFNNRSNYHERNKCLLIYKTLLSRKNSLQKQEWKKQFVYDISPLLDKYMELQKTEPLHSAPPKKLSNETLVLREKDVSQEMIHLNVAFVSRHRRHELPPPIPEMEECIRPECEREPLVLIQKEARLLCRRCGQKTKHLNTSSNGLSFGDEPDNNSTQHAYERKKNFKSYLSQFHVHAKEIPEKLLRDLHRAFRNILVTSKSEIRCTFLKDWLKQSEEHRKYIDCSARIVNILNNRPVPKFTQEQIDMFVDMFVQTQLPFLHFKDSTRQNFLNSCYLMNKFVGIKKMKHLQSAFPLLRHKKTLLEQDRIWAKICTDLVRTDKDWIYEKSI